MHDIPAKARHALLRQRDGHHAKVAFEELFFDLVYVFAVTQLAHGLVHHLSLMGAVETLVLWFAVWLGWQYTAWVTNWFDPETPRIRGLLFATMLIGLVMGAAIPDAFGDRGFIFAGAFVLMQVGRSAVVLVHLRGHALFYNYRRILIWGLIAAVFWIAGAFAHHEWRIILWACAVLCDYISPMIGFRLPGLGRSVTSDWTIEGGHLVERCHLFVIVALGETVLATGLPLSRAETWDAATLLAVLSTFLGTLVMWWLYFGTSSKDATAVITKSDDPGRMGAYFHYVHVILIGGVIVSAVGNDLTLAHPHEVPGTAQAIAMVAGPAIYLFGSILYKKAVYGVVALSHVVGVAVLAALFFAGAFTDLLVMSGLTTAVMIAIAIWEDRKRRCLP